MVAVHWRFFTSIQLYKENFNTHKEVTCINRINC